MRPVLLPENSVIHRCLPSGPSTLSVGPEPAVGTAYSTTATDPSARAAACDPNTWVAARTAQLRLTPHLLALFIVATPSTGGAPESAHHAGGGDEKYAQTRAKSPSSTIHRPTMARMSFVDRSRTTRPTSFSRIPSPDAEMLTSVPSRVTVPASGSISAVKAGRSNASRPS